MLRLINLSPNRLFNYDETGQTVVQHKVCKGISLEVNDGSVYLQQRGVHSWHLLPAWMPPLRMFLLLRCFVGATWRLNSWIALLQVQYQLVTRLDRSRTRALRNGSNIFPVFWSRLNTFPLFWRWMVTVFIPAISWWHCAQENCVHIVCLPPHSSNKLQPLDFSFLQLMKIFYTWEVEIGWKIIQT